jgi:hypothetical protein
MKRIPFKGNEEDVFEKDIRGLYNWGKGMPKYWKSRYNRRFRKKAKEDMHKNLRLK